MILISYTILTVHNKNTKTKDKKKLQRETKRLVLLGYMKLK